MNNYNASALILNKVNVVWPINIKVNSSATPVPIFLDMEAWGHMEITTLGRRADKWNRFGLELKEGKGGAPGL